MNRIDDPFANDLITSAAPKLESEAHTASHLFDYVETIRRIAEIEDELSRRSIDPLEKELESLKKTLKSNMLADKRSMAYDEVSNYEAIIVQRSSDVWDAEALKSILNSRQRDRYIVESVSIDAVEDGIKTGDLSRPTLEKVGAVVKKAGAQALYIRARKDEEND